MTSIVQKTRTQRAAKRKALKRNSAVVRLLSPKTPDDVTEVSSTALRGQRKPSSFREALIARFCFIGEKLQGAFRIPFTNYNVKDDSTFKQEGVRPFFQRPALLWASFAIILLG